jgi:hypothetical protein
LNDVDRPLGLFLKSKEREQLVWDLMMPPWAFGIRSIEQESVLIQSLTRDSLSSGDVSHELIAPAEFIRNSHDQNDPLSSLQERFQEVISGHQHFAKIVDVLTALNEVINYEVRSIFDAWYIEVDSGPPMSVEIIKRFPDAVKEELGIFYRTAVTEERS